MREFTAGCVVGWLLARWLPVLVFRRQLSRVEEVVEEW